MSERRESYRVPVSLTLPRASRLDHRDRELEQLDAIVRDISLSGLQMSVEQVVTVGDLLELELPIGEALATLVLRATVIHAVPPRRGGRYRVGVRFTAVAPEQDRELSRFIYREQGRLLQKGLLVHPERP